MRRMRAAVAGRLRRAADRLDPPTGPYGVWDPTTQELAIKIPARGGGSVTLARVDIEPGMVRDVRR